MVAFYLKHCDFDFWGSCIKKKMSRTLKNTQFGKMAPKELIANLTKARMDKMGEFGPMIPVRIKGAEKNQANFMR